MTRRQYQVLSFVEDFIQANGYAPTYQEIADRFRFASLSTVWEHLSHLVKQGRIEIEPMAPRGIRLAGTCKHCGRSA